MDPDAEPRPSSICSTVTIPIWRWRLGFFPPVAATDVLGRMWKLHMSIQWRTHLHFIMFMCNMCIIYILICVYMIISIYLYTHVHSHTYEMQLCQQSRQQLWGIGGLVYIYISPFQFPAQNGRPCAPYQGYFLGKNKVSKWGWALHFVETVWELHVK